MDVSAIFLKKDCGSKLYFFSNSMNYASRPFRNDHLRVLLLQNVLELEQHDDAVVDAFRLQGLLRQVTQCAIGEDP